MHKEGVFLFFIFSLYVWDVFTDVYCGSGFLLLPLWCPGTEQGRMEQNRVLRSTSFPWCVWAPVHTSLERMKPSPKCVGQKDLGLAGNAGREEVSSEDLSVTYVQLVNSLR